MRYFKAFLVISLILVAISCSKERGYPVKSEIIDGVKVVTNPEYPRDGVVNYQLEEELSIGFEQGDEDYLFNKVQDVQVAEDGRIYVLDWGDTCIKVYDNQGKHLQTIGREGQGPGEFSKYSEFAICPDGKIYILDTGNFRLSILGTNGFFLNSFRLSGLYFRIKTDNNNFIYLEKIFQDEAEEESKMSIHRYNYKGEEVLNYGNFKIVQPIVTKRTATSVSTTTSRVAPSTVWAVAEDGRLFAGYGGNYQIDVYDPDGKLSLKFGRAFMPIPDKFYRGEPGQNKYMSAFVIITHWFFDEDNNLWVEVFPKENKEEIETFIYDIFSPDGIYLNQAYVRNRIFHFKNGKAYSIVKSEAEFPVVKRFRLVKNG